jgi:2-hydroxy-6-oxonona-2,4-dienedioate hydrolase
MRLHSGMDFAINAATRLTTPKQNTGLCLLLLHGFFGNAHNWEPTIAALAKRHKVLAPQLPFFGLDRKVDRISHLTNFLDELLQAHPDDQIVAVGNSLGGQLAVHLALHRPGRVAGLVLTGSSGLYERNLTNKIQRHPPREWVRERVREIFYDDVHVTDQQVDDVMALLYDRKKAYDILYLAKSIRNESLRSVLPQVTCPVTLIWGADDRITPPDTAEEFKALLPQAELHFIPRCGHAAMMEQPQTFNRLVENFLKRLACDAPAPEKPKRTSKFQLQPACKS